MSDRSIQICRLDIADMSGNGWSAWQVNALKDDTGVNRAWKNLNPNNFATVKSDSAHLNPARNGMLLVRHHGLNLDPFF
jgi:hypothetical protein